MVDKRPAPSAERNIKGRFISLREKSPNMEVFLVHIFLYSDRIRRFTEQKKLRIYSVNTFHAVFASLAIEMQELAPILDSVVETLRINKYTGSHKQQE